MAGREAVRARAPQLTEGAVRRVAAALRRGVYVERTAAVEICRDPADDVFLACALAAGAQFLVTEDKDLLALDGCEGLRILTPAAFIALLEHGKGA